jgi:hypothetical protein
VEGSGATNSMERGDGEICRFEGVGMGFWRGSIFINYLTSERRRLFGG